MHDIETGWGRFTWTTTGRVRDADGNDLFQIRGVKRVAEQMVLACIESYHDGLRHGWDEGQAAKLDEIQKALGISEPNRPSN